MKHDGKNEYCCNTLRGRGSYGFLWKEEDDDDVMGNRFRLLTSSGEAVEAFNSHTLRDFRPPRSICEL